MLELWREHATEQEIKEYDKLGHRYHELFAEYYKTIDEGLASFNIPHEVHTEDDGEEWDDTYELVDALYNFTPPQNRRKEHLSLIGKIESLIAEQDANYKKQANIVSTCMDRYRDAVNGNKQTLLDDAQRMATDFINSMLQVTASIIDRGKVDDAPREMEITNIFRGSSFGSIRYIAESWQIDITDDLQKIAEQVAKEYKKQAGALLEQAFKEITAQGQPLTQPLKEGNKEKQALVVGDYIKSKTFLALNSKVYNKYSAIQNDMLSINSDGQIVMFANEYALQVSPDRAPVVYTYVSLSYEGELAPKLAKLTAYDKCVLNALCTAFQAGNRIIKIDDIYRVINGNTDKKPSQATHEKIKKSLKKLNNTWIYIDYSQELQNDYINIDGMDERIERAYIEGHLIDIYFDTKVTSRGRAVDTIKIGTPPILLAYSLLKKNPQIISIPMEMLNTKSVSATDDISVMREYLAKQVTMMKNGKGHDNSNILYKTLFRECTIELPADPTELKTFMQRKRQAITKILTEWKESKYIKAFEEQKTGREFTGVTITV